MKPEDRKRLKQHIEMIVEHKEPDVIAQENFKKLQDEVTDLREKNIKLRLELQTLRFKESQENRFVWWVYQVYARNVLDLVQSVPVMCPCDTEEDVPFIELAARIKEYTEHIYDGTYLDTAMSTEQSNSDVSATQDVLTDIKTGQSIENTNPDYYKDELYLDEDFRMLAKTYPADVSAIGVTTLIDYVEAVEAENARLTAENERLSQLLHDEMSQLQIATDLGNKRWLALNDIYENGEKHNSNWCKRKAQEGLSSK